MEDYLHAKGMWYWIHADTPDRIADPKGWRKYAEARDQAVGEIRHHIAPELRSIAVSSTDPESILESIQAAYGASSFATRHNALQAFLAVKQEASEPVAAFIGRSHEALRFLQLTRPLSSSHAFSCVPAAVFAPGVQLRAPGLCPSPGNSLQHPDDLPACPVRADSAAG